MKISSIATVLLLVTMFAAGCKKDPIRIPCNGSQPTWDGEVSAIVANSCLGSKCHSTGTWQVDFTTYSSMKEVLDNGKFEKKVLEKRSMPKNGTLPDSTLATLQCWVDGGYQEH